VDGTGLVWLPTGDDGLSDNFRFRGQTDRQIGERMNEGKSVRNKQQIWVISTRNRHTHGMRFPGTLFVCDDSTISRTRM